MENEQEKKYFIIWLYISIFLHLFVVIIMLILKSTNAPKDPDPASNNETQVIFMQDQPDDKPTAQEDYQLAQRIQTGDMKPQQENNSSKQAQADVPEAALSDEYKKAVANKTIMKDQSPDGQVNFNEHTLQDLYEQLQKQNSPASQQTFDQLDTSALTPIKKVSEPKKPSSKVGAAIIQNIMQEKIQSSSMQNNSDSPSQPEPQKVISKKHRPADVGSENLSKVQLSKQSQETSSPKKKITLQDLQQGFSLFLNTAGNEQFFSRTGNADQDNMQGLKRASYNRQIGLMYETACHTTTKFFDPAAYQKTSDNSSLEITIERSGKISNCTLIISCGVDALDRHHMQIIDSIGSFPPIPKYIEAPLKIRATLYFHPNRNYSGTFIPIRTE